MATTAEISTGVEKVYQANFPLLRSVKVDMLPSVICVTAVDDWPIAVPTCIGTLSNKPPVYWDAALTLLGPTMTTLKKIARTSIKCPTRFNFYPPLAIYWFFYTSKIAFLIMDVHTLITNK
ncbi:hypothetical protein NYE76_29570 [Paenibacillus sp. FSL M7-0831]|uniref:hypothetical protein n=1 Tax=Paenibacillus macerans TaxID=44252 RepID=UPI001D131823|nr:hypothetical protein [Paenibacillus macerans]